MFILGTKVHNITFGKAIKKAEGFLRDGEQHYIVTPNPEIVLRASSDIKYRSILNKSDLSIPDGVGIVWASRRLHKNPIKETVPGVDFMIALLARVNYGAGNRDRPYRALLLGGRGGVAKKAAVSLKKKFPAIDFWGIEKINGVNSNFALRELIQPDFIFVAMGSPKQEVWISNNMKKFPSAKIAMGVGGALDMISEKYPRAPRLMRQHGLEWLWRLIIDPRRLPRIWRATVVFPVRVMREKPRI